MSANRPGPSGLFPNLARTRDDLSSAWVQMFRDLSTKVRESGLDPDAPAQKPTYNPGMERYGTETLFPDSGSAGMRPIPTPEEQAANRAAIGQFGRDVLLGPERGSWIPGLGDASRLERFARDWGVSEQEFRLSAERFQEGRIGGGVGWGGLAIAAAVPIVGQTGRGLVRGGRAATRAASRADDVAAAARSQRETDSLLKQMDDLWHSEAGLDWLYAFGDVAEGEEIGRALVGGRMVTVPNRYDDLFRQLDDQFPNLQEFAGRFVDDFSEVYEYRMMLQEAMAAGGRLPDNERTWSLWAGLSAMEVSPPTRSVAYRAMRVTPEEAAQWQRGAEVDLPISSFSYNQNEVWQYFDPTGNQGNLPTNVMFVLEPGARALPMGALTSEGSGYGPAVIGEIATAGTFRITNVQRVTLSEKAMGGPQRAPIQGDVLEVTVQQIAPFAIEEVGQDVFVRSVLGESSTLASASGPKVLGAAQAARPVRQNILEDVSLELTLEGGLNYTLPADRLAAVPEQRRVFAEIVHRQGFDGPPQAVPQNEFRRLMGDQNNVVIYRGIRGGEATRGAHRGQTVDAEQAAYDFISGEFYMSGGVGNTSGAYFTTDSRAAIDYATEGLRSGASTQLGAVVAAVIPGGYGRVFDFRAAGREFYAEMRAAGFDDLGAYLAAQNYDAVRFGGWTEPTLDIAVFNRTALTVIDEPLMFQPGRQSALRAERLGGGDFPYNDGPSGRDVR